MFGSSRWSPMGSNSNAGCDESFKHRLSGTGGKHGAPWSETRSVVGQTRRFRDVTCTSGPPPTADVSGSDRHFALGHRLLAIGSPTAERFSTRLFERHPTAIKRG